MAKTPKATPAKGGEKKKAAAAAPQPLGVNAFLGVAVALLLSIVLYQNRAMLLPASGSSEEGVAPAAASATPAEGDWTEPKQGAVLEMWDPVAINHTRKLKLDDSGRLYEMRTLSLDPPIFEIPDFLSDGECEKIMRLANQSGLFKSDHTYLDGSNLNDKDKKLDEGMTEAEADKLFRYSDQTWLPPHLDNTLAALKKRAAKLAQVPVHVSEQSEQLQVVHYKHYGHYESHYDSEKDSLGPCCIDPVAVKGNMRTGVEALQMPLNKRCRLCRYMTILYFLVDTEEGGGTVFPLADTTEEEYEAWANSNHYTKYKQTRTCSPGLKVAPGKRKAVLWYNHHLDRGYLGPLNKRSLHGGCNVIEGQKWIANHWLSALPHPDVPRTPAVGHY